LASVRTKQILHNSTNVCIILTFYKRERAVGRRHTERVPPHGARAAARGAKDGDVVIRGTSRRRTLIALSVSDWDLRVVSEPVWSPVVRPDLPLGFW